MKIKFLYTKVVVLLFFVTSSIDAQVTIGMDKEPPVAAILNLQTQEDTNGVTSTKGGLLMPRVELVSLETLEPFIVGTPSETNKSVHKGLVVYNIGGNGISAGQYFWNGDKWENLVTDATPLAVKTNGIYALENDVLALNLLTGYDKMFLGEGNYLSFGTYNPLTKKHEVVINEDGAYAFSFNILAEVPVTAGYLASHVCTYIGIFCNSTPSNVNMIECMEQQQEIVRSTTNVTTTEIRRYTINTTLSVNLKRGDVITFKTGCYCNDVANTSNYFWKESIMKGKYAGATSTSSDVSYMTYWKL